MTLHDDILTAMRRLASRGEVDVSAMRIADIVQQTRPRPYMAAMETALDDLLDEKAIEPVGQPTPTPEPVAEPAPEADPAPPAEIPKPVLSKSIKFI